MHSLSTVVVSHDRYVYRVRYVRVLSPSMLRVILIRFTDAKGNHEQAANNSKSSTEPLFIVVCWKISTTIYTHSDGARIQPMSLPQQQSPRKLKIGIPGYLTENPPEHGWVKLDMIIISQKHHTEGNRPNKGGTCDATERKMRT